MANRRPWRGIDADTRHADRKERLLDAAFDLVGTGGAGAVTVRGVCALAGLNSRYFYESFADTDALLGALVERIAAETLAHAADAAEQAGGDARARLAAALHAVARDLTGDPRRLRVLVTEAQERPALARRRIEVLRTVAHFGEQAGYAAFGPLPPGERAGRDAAHFVAGGLAELLLAFADGEIDTPVDQLVDEAVDLIMGVQRATAALATRRARC